MYCFLDQNASSSSSKLSFFACVMLSTVHILYSKFFGIDGFDAKLVIHQNFPFQ